MIRRTAVRKRRKGVRRGPARSAAYKAWIRTLPCVICFRNWPASEAASAFFEGAEFSGRIRSECAHVGARGLGQKCSDFETVPLCMEHHRTGKESHHVLGKRFEGFHGISFAAIIQALRTAFANRKGVMA